MEEDTQYNIEKIKKMLVIFQSVLKEFKNPNDDIFIKKYTKRVSIEEEKKILEVVNKYYVIAEKIILGDTKFGSMRKIFEKDTKLKISYLNRWTEYEFNPEIMEKSMVVVAVYLQELINKELNITDMMSEVLSHYIDEP